MTIARIFPRRTSYSPDDSDAYFGPPDLFTPKYDKAFISVSFTWDKPFAEELKNQWKNHAREVDIGGPAYEDGGGILFRECF